MANVDLQAVRDEWVGKVYDTTEFPIDAQHLVDWAVACGETESRFTEPDDADFQAHPGYVSHFTAGRWTPKGFPELGNGRGVDGGKAVEIFGPIRPGDVLTASTEIADVYDKTGRSGTMIFVVNRMTFRNQHGDKVATVDWRQIRATDG
ncbi:MAG: MaoC family dehydratase N-terminal domain-containing protein [Acidimicrobiia bacterium]|nr:MaoC family dehydratase N-terminal domain-containing protein [Acidimicrobiia bacterium]